MKSWIILSTTLATFQQLFAKYIFDSWEFAAFLAVAICVDTITGVWAAYKRNNIASNTFGKVFTKIILYALFLVVLHGLANFNDDPISKTVFSWLNSAGYAAVIGREALSIVENIGKIKPDLIPRWIGRKLKSYNEDGNNSI
jgi:phage-related holin